MSSVRYCSQTNSTLFTTCCGVAICHDESKCSVCKIEIWPRSDRDRHDVAMYALYGREAVQRMRDKWTSKRGE